MDPEKAMAPSDPTFAEGLGLASFVIGVLAAWFASQQGLFTGFSPLGEPGWAIFVRLIGPVASIALGWSSLLTLPRAVGGRRFAVAGIALSVVAAILLVVVELTPEPEGGF